MMSRDSVTAITCLRSSSSPKKYVALFSHASLDRSGDYTYIIE